MEKKKVRNLLGSTMRCKPDVLGLIQIVLTWMQTLSEELIKKQIAGLLHYHSEHKAHIMNILDEGYTQLKSTVDVLEEKISQLNTSRKQSWTSPQGDVVLDENDCRDVHVNTVDGPNSINKVHMFYTCFCNYLCASVLACVCEGRVTEY